MRLRFLFGRPFGTCTKAAGRGRLSFGLRRIIPASGFRCHQDGFSSHPLPKTFLFCQAPQRDGGKSRKSILAGLYSTTTASTEGTERDWKAAIFGGGSAASEKEAAKGCLSKLLFYPSATSEKPTLEALPHTPDEQPAHPAPPPAKQRTGAKC